jgi:cysteinyl-tRNA synthetase
MAIRLFDSLSRELRELRPSQPDGVFRFYNCGPTVYGPAHIGNFRTFVVNDVIRRVLELEFGADKVCHVRNITDVDDRTIGQALKEKRPLGEITQHWTKLFHEDCAALNLLPPHVEPSATDHIAEQVAMIEGLMAKGHAYAAPDGSVYFKIGSFPEYGALSRIKERELKVTNTAADSDHKDSVGDFALWKAYKPEEDGDVRWPGPRGAAAGRPGWHIECSAMIRKHLGPTIDLHTGGVDLLFPHHENEIAQSECGNGAHFANHWYHSEHLLVNGTTMSKSKGNYYTLRDLVAKGYSPMAVRYALLAGHPRKQLNFTLESLHAAEKNVSAIREAIEDLGVSADVLSTRKKFDAVLTEQDRTNWGSFSKAYSELCDNLNVPSCLGEAFKAFDVFVLRESEGTFPPPVARIEFFAAVRLFQDALGVSLKLRTDDEKPEPKPETPNNVVWLAEQRWAAKKAKDFAAADKLRAEITAAGWSMLDGKEGYKLEPLKK